MIAIWFAYLRYGLPREILTNLLFILSQTSSSLFFQWFFLKKAAQNKILDNVIIVSRKIIKYFQPIRIVDFITWLIVIYSIALLFSITLIWEGFLGVSIEGLGETGR